MTGDLASLSPVERTLLIPLWARATYRGGGFADPAAAALLARLGVDATPIARDMGEYGTIALGERARRLDAIAVDFFRRHPDGLAVHVGGGLDEPEARVPSGRFLTVELPGVAALRRRLLPHAATRATDEGDWTADLHGPTLVMLAGVHMYLPPSVSRPLLARLLSLANVELAFDAYSPVGLALTRLAVAGSSLPEAQVHGSLSTREIADLAGRRPWSGAALTPPDDVRPGPAARWLLRIAAWLRFSTLWHIGTAPR